MPRVSAIVPCYNYRDAADWYLNAFARRPFAPAPLFLALSSAVEAVGRRSSRAISPSPSAEAARTPEA